LGSFFFFCLFGGLRKEMEVLGESEGEGGEV